MKHQNRIAIGVALTFLWITSFGTQESAAAPFQNLDFEDVVITPGPGPGSTLAALPYWADNTEYFYYDGYCLAPGCLSIHDSQSTLAPLVPLEGDYSLLLQGPAVDENYNPIGPLSIWQTGDIPAGINELRLLAYGYEPNDPEDPYSSFNLEVGINGINIPLSVLSTIDGVSTLSGDISAFAGTTAELTIGSWDPSYSETFVVIDNITFIPEPSTALLLALGLGGIAAVGKRRASGRRSDFLFHTRPSYDFGAYVTGLPPNPERLGGTVEQP